MYTIKILYTAIAIGMICTFQVDAQTQQETEDIFEVLQKDERFSTFAQLLDEAELLDLLQNEETYTVFAPTNEAFEELEEQEFSDLRADENKLREVLLGHIYVGEIVADHDGRFDEMMIEQRVDTQEGPFRQAGAITEVNIRAENGIIHAINTVIIPEEQPEDVPEMEDRDKTPLEAYDR